MGRPPIKSKIAQPDVTKTILPKRKTAPASKKAAAWDVLDPRWGQGDTTSVVGKIANGIPQKLINLMKPGKKNDREKKTR